VPRVQDKTEPTAEINACDHYCHDIGEWDAQLDKEAAEPRQISEALTLTRVDEHDAFNQAYQENGEPCQGLEAAGEVRDALQAFRALRRGYDYELLRRQGADLCPGLSRFALGATPAPSYLFDVVAGPMMQRHASRACRHDERKGRDESGRDPLSTTSQSGQQGMHSCTGRVWIWM
jgi:hypothetical protein